VATRSRLTRPSRLLDSRAVVGWQGIAGAVFAAAVAMMAGAASAAPAAAATLSGLVVSGPAPVDGASQTPVAGSTVTLVAARASRAVAIGTATTDDAGAFAIDYRPPPGGPVLYAVARGGTVMGISAPPDRRPGAAIRMMSVVRAEGRPLDEVVISEPTTVAAVFALAQFVRGNRASGPSPGLPVAAATAGNLYQAGTGKVAGVLANSPNGNATEALPTFNALANIMARCTRGTRAACARLFAAATAPGQARPTDTIRAMHNIARRPTNALARLHRLQRRVFRPSLRSAPTAWVLALVYTDGGFDSPGRMAFDSVGRIWANNNFEPPGTEAGTGLTVVSGAGAPIMGSPLHGGGLSGSGWGIAIDARDRVWLSNFAGASVSLFSSAGKPLSPPHGFRTAGLSNPQGVTVDPSGNVWIANWGGDSVIVYPGGSPAAARTITGGGIANPFSIAIDSSGEAWVTNGAQSTDPADSSVTRIVPDGSGGFTTTRIAGGGLLSPQGIAVDSGDNLWIGNFESGSVTRIDPQGRITPDSPVRTRSLVGPWGIAVDGSDNVWVADFLGTSLTQLCGRQVSACPPGTATGQPISPPRTGYTNRGIQHTTAVQIDQSGNVWLANNWSTSSPIDRFVGGNGLVEFVGLATPVQTPLIGLPRRT